MATDYVLALVALWAAAWLWRHGSGAPGRWWAAAFVATAVAAVLGGTSHGYAPVMSTALHLLVWRLTYVSVALANLCIGYGAALAALPSRWQGTALQVLRVRFVGVSAGLIALAEFRYALYDFAITLAALLATGMWLAARRLPGAAWVLAGAAVSAAGAALQLFKVGHGHAFNHNDWFHVVQALGIVMYARAGRDLVVRRPV